MADGAESERWVTLAVRGDIAGAEILRGVLEAHEIPARLEGLADRAIVGFTSGLSIQVPEDRLPEAQEVLAALEKADSEEEEEDQEDEEEQEQAEPGAEKKEKTKAARAKPASAEPRRPKVVTLGVSVLVPGGATFLAGQMVLGLSLLLAFVAAWFTYVTGTALILARVVCFGVDLLVAWRSSKRAAAGRSRSPFGQLVIGLLCWPPILAAGWFGGGLDALATFDRVDVCSPVFECWSDCGEDQECGDGCLDDSPAETRTIVLRFADCSDRRCGNVSEARRAGCEEDHCADELAECTRLVPKSRRRLPSRRQVPRSDWP